MVVQRRDGPIRWLYPGHQILHLFLLVHEIHSAPIAPHIVLGTFLCKLPCLMGVIVVVLERVIPYQILPHFHHGVLAGFGCETFLPAFEVNDRLYVFCGSRHDCQRDTARLLD